MTTHSTYLYGIPSSSDLDVLETQIRHAFDTITLPPNGGPLRLKPLAGSVLRLIFHDCGGPSEGNIGPISKCDGCIELDDFAEHQNLGFRAVDPLDDIYLNSTYQWNTKLSRADFWAFAATLAIKHTRDEAEDNDILPNIPIFFGRKDCSTSPDVDDTITQTKPFPSGIAGWQSSFNWLHTNFGFNQEETVAILGAHTIGRTHPDDSGFNGPWVRPWGTFDNFYYQQIINGAWQQRETPNLLLKEWAESDEPRFIMLNVDIALWRNLDAVFVPNDCSGAVSCGSNITQCPINSITRDIVEGFADDNQLWLNKFVPAFIKMITAGYDIDCDLIAVNQNGMDSSYWRKKRKCSKKKRKLYKRKESLFLDLLSSEKDEDKDLLLLCSIFGNILIVFVVCSLCCYIQKDKTYQTVMIASSGDDIEY